MDHPVACARTILPLRVLACGFAFLIASTEVTSSTCAPTPLATAFEGADYVFEGAVTARSRIESSTDELCTMRGELCGSKVAEFSVSQVWKGSLDTATTVYSQDACLCLGSYFEEGDRYIVFAMKSRGQDYALEESQACGATRLYSYRIAKILDDIRDGKPFPARVPLIVDANVVSSEVTEWINGLHRSPCGYKQTLRINETFRGPEASTLSIATSQPLSPGQRYLLHLDNDPGRSFESPTGSTPVDDQRKIYECVQALPEFRTAWPDPMRIYEFPKALIDVESFYASPQSGMPDFVMTIEPGAISGSSNGVQKLDPEAACDVLDGACQARGLVRWDEFRAWIKSAIDGGKPDGHQ